MIGLNCGGSDTTSGLVANPALGIASDKLVAQGGSSILTELTELLGTEHILARRAVNEQVAQRYPAGDPQHGRAAQAADAQLQQCEAKEFNLDRQLRRRTFQCG